MRTGKTLLLASVAFTAAFLGEGIQAGAQNADTLSGSVSSPTEPVMEGVIVNARKDGSNITVAVVSDDKGHYSFPAGRLSPGHYQLSIRAVGYDLQGPAEIDIPAGGATADIKLDVTKNLAMQLNNAELMMSAATTRPSVMRLATF